MSAATARRSQNAAEQRAQQVRERILAAFSERAKRSGLRSVVMVELASELRMSATTLYKHFASKEELVVELVERWVMEVAAAEAVTPEQAERRTALDLVRHWAEVWSVSMSQLSVAFIQDLQREYPEAWKLFWEGLEERKRVGAELLRPLLRPDINGDVALELLSFVLARVADPKFADELGTSRSEAIQTAVAVWAAGAVARQDRLRPVGTVRKHVPKRRGGKG
jgi:AcrR family transcriptional regulator